MKQLNRELGGLSILFLVFICLHATSTLAQTALVNFNTPGQLGGQFNLWNDVGGANSGNYDYQESTTAGVGGSGAVSVFTSTDCTAVYKGGSWNLATNGATMTVSILVKANGQTSGDKVQLGVMNSNANGLNSNPGISFESFRFVPTGTVWSLREQYRTNNTSTENTLGNVNITVGHWYKFQVSLTNVSGASGNYNAACAIYDYGTDGLTPGANIVTFSTLRNNLAQDIATNTAVWPALRAFQDGGIDAWDNFSVFTSASKPFITLALTNTAVPNGQTASFKALADGPGTISYAWYTNGIIAAGASGVSYTTVPVNSTFTNVMVVASNGNGSTTNTATITVLVPNLAVVTNQPATGIQATSATLNGQVISTGGDTPIITFYYGTNNGGSSASAWSNSIALGLQTGFFSQTVSGLSTNKIYFFTASASNSVGVAWAGPSQTFTTLSNGPASAPGAMLTYHNDNTRQGANTNETILAPANVNSATFGKLFSYAVDGYVYAQPLVVTNVTIPGKGTHNVVYIVTEHDSIYAFDADSNAGVNASPLWQVSFLNAAAGVTTVPGGDTGTGDIVPEIGATATPVIDPVTGTIYLEVKTKEVSGNVTSYVHRLHALDITTGAEKVSMNSPVVINAVNYPGTGTPGFNDNDGAGHVVFNTLREHTRVALTLVNGVIYLGYASHGDNQPYHGWLFAYDAHSLAQLSVYNSTPNGGLGGFWQGGGGATVDTNGNLYYETGNGSFDATGSTFSQANNSFGMSVLKFSTTNGVLKLQDFFSPHDEQSLSDGDVDLGSGAPIILPDSVGSAAHPHLLVAAGKDGRIYLIDQTNMGHFQAGSDSQIVQVVQNALGGGSYMTPAFFNKTLYYVCLGDRLKAFSISNGVISPTPVQTSTVFGDKGSSSPSISANGLSNAIVWAIESDAYASSGPGILHAYNATNVAQELYNSSQNLARDNPGGAVKFTVPTIINGKVYVGAEYTLSVYGIGNFLPTPVISPNGGIFTNSITVSITDTAPGVQLYYTQDGTVPNSNSIPYTGAFVLTNNVGIQAVAVKAGFVNSGIASAGFINSSSIGNGAGLLAQYWTTTTSAAFDSPTFSTPPTLTRVDATINTNWGNGSPDPSISVDTFTARWTGAVEPQYNETYTFYTTTDDGVRLWVNGQLLIDKWVDQGPTTWTGTIALKAQQRYNIRMDYYENGGGAEAILAWSSPSTPQAVIPSSQLFPVTNPPPVVVLTGPTNGTTLTASATVTLAATAAAQFNAISEVDFYTNNALLGKTTVAPYALTTAGLPSASYLLRAVAFDTTGLASTSAPVIVSVMAGSGLAYGLTNRAPVSPFLNMPSGFTGSLPPTLSQTGVFSDTPNMVTASGLIPYNVIVPLWSDGAVKTRWLAVPNSGAPYTSDQQIAFAPTGEWTFPSGTVFVKHFGLVTDYSNSNAPPRRLETRLLVRDTNGAVYGVTYKWRPDNSDADLLAASLNENITITNADHTTWTQTWYYPSPADCLTCHTPAANYVLGVKTRQLDGTFSYPNAVTDNQLRTLNRAGLFYPAIDESTIAGYTHLVAVTNQSGALVDRARSYIDANCAQCHRPNGSGPSFDARWDTALTNQNLINGPLAKGDLGYDHAYVVVPRDIWRSILYQRADSLDPAVKMPPLARNVIDTNSLAVVAAWINSLPGGLPALAPPVINPAGGIFQGSVQVTIQPPDINAAIYFTLDGTLPTNTSSLYTGPLVLTNSLTLRANAFESGFTNSVAAGDLFTILPGVNFVGLPTFSNGVFQTQLSVQMGKSYIFQASTNLSTWISLSTNSPLSSPFNLVDPAATNYPFRFYRAIQQP